MDGKQLERAQRITLNLPVVRENIKTGRTKTNLGSVYIGYGKARDGVWHGVYFTDAMGGTGQTVEFEEDNDETAVESSLFAMGYQSMQVWEQNKLRSGVNG